VYDYLCEQPSLTTPCGGHDMPGCSLTLLLRCCLYTAGVAGLSLCLYYSAACCMWHCVDNHLADNLASCLAAEFTLSCTARAVLLSIVTMVLCCLTSLSTCTCWCCLSSFGASREKVEHVRLLRFFFSSLFRSLLCFRE